jgi:hypothetical protein
MDFGTIVQGLFGKKDEQPTTTLDHPSFTSSRLLLVLAFVAVILYSTRGVLTEANIRIISQVVMVLIIGNSLTRIACYAANAFIKGRAMRLAWNDGTLTAEEAAVVAGATAPQVP